MNTTILIILGHFIAGFVAAIIIEAMFMRETVYDPCYFDNTEEVGGFVFMCLFGYIALITSLIGLLIYIVVGFLKNNLSKICWTLGNISFKKGKE